MEIADNSHKDNKKQSKREAKSKPAKPEDVTIDVENRDPNYLNSHIIVSFDEVIGEPGGAHSKPIVWTNVNKAFSVGMTCCFTCLTYLCAIPLVFLWGCYFACITFCHIYSITPCFKVFWINCDCASKFFSATIHCLCDPLYEAIALMFTKIFVSVRQNAEPFPEKSYMGANLFSVRKKKINSLQVIKNALIVQDHEPQQQQAYYNEVPERDNEIYENVK